MHTSFPFKTEQVATKIPVQRKVSVRDPRLGSEDLDAASLMSFTNTEAAVHLCGAFVIIRSIRDDYSGHCELGLVGLSTI